MLEYCSVVWHHGLTNTQCQNLGALQRHDLRIIVPDAAGMPYILAMGYAQMSSLHSGRQEANKCLPILLYCLEVCPLNKSDLRSLDFTVTRLGAYS